MTTAASRTSPISLNNTLITATIVSLDHHDVVAVASPRRCIGLRRDSIRRRIQIVRHCDAIRRGRRGRGECGDDNLGVRRTHFDIRIDGGIVMPSIVRIVQAGSPRE